MDQPRTTDLAQRIVALQRRSAPPARRLPAQPSSQQQSTPTPTAAPAPRPDSAHFSRLNISAAAAASPKSPKLYVPNTDAPAFHMRRTAEPEQGLMRPMPDSDPTRHVLFDPRKDDPVRFNVLTRTSRPIPTPKSSGDASASSTSQTSSIFTLSSDTTGGSSASSALFDVSHKSENTNVLSNQLKRMYREITSLEALVKQEDSDENADEPARILTRAKIPKPDEDASRERWDKQLKNHKRLAECIHGFLNISLAPNVPASLRGIPIKYNIIVRLWSYAFHKLLESLRRASFSSPLALEHLQDFIYYSYTFYCGLLEDPLLSSFKSGWLEALGDLARYKMAVCAMVIASQRGTSSALTTAAVKAATTERSGSSHLHSQSSDRQVARIDDEECGPSVGVAAARSMDMEPEQERWRNIAREWFSSGLADQPGTGRLHHHLGLLSREAEGEELRGVYHFVKSMTTLHPFNTSRESILPLWSVAAQSKRSQPDARVPDLFVLLHGMLFTNIQLDDFQPTLARFLERLQLEGAEEKEWIMMAVINMSAILEYGRSTGVLKKAGVVGGRGDGPKDAAAQQKVMITKKGAVVARSPVMMHEDHMDVDGSPISARMQLNHPPSPASTSETDPPQADEEQPLAFKLAMQLAFRMLSFVLKNPTRKPTPFARSTLNPYLTVLLTFIATVLKSPQGRHALERSIPWEDLADFFTVIPRDVMVSQNLMGSSPASGWTMLTSSCAPPLSEDWCMRGMEWVGRKVFERGYWKSGEERRVELEVLDERSMEDLTDGRIEDDDEDEDNGEKRQGETWKRWVRIVRCGVDISDYVDGFSWTRGTREWTVEGKLAEKVRQWKEYDVLQMEEEEMRRMHLRMKWADDSMDVDGENGGGADDDDDDDDEHSEESDDEHDSEQVKELRARRKYLRSLLQASSSSSSPPPSSSSSPAKHPRTRTRSGKPAPTLPTRQLIPGYSVLVVDTNVFLSMLSMLSSLVDSRRWTVVVPLPVIMELDGLSSNVSPQLGEVAQSALAYLESHIRSHSASLKVQTSKGNYLSSLKVRTEQVDFRHGGGGGGGGNSEERSMDDLILKAAIWQDEHWVNRSVMLQAEKSSEVELGKDAVKVALLTLDRNMRLKARSRQLYAATEKELAALFATT